MTMAMLPLQRIEARRLEAGLSIEDLAGAAGLSQRHYQRLRHGDEPPKRATIARLKSALWRLTGRPAHVAVPEIRLVLYAYFATLGIVCARAGVETAAVHGQDPKRKATADKDWMVATKLRHQAIYLVNAGLGIPQNDIAQALGLTPAAISLACRGIESEREDGDMDRLMDELTRTITGDAG